MVCRCVLLVDAEDVSRVAAACVVTVVGDLISRLDKDLASGERRISPFTKLTPEGLDELDPCELFPAPALSVQGDAAFLSQLSFSSLFASFRLVAKAFLWFAMVFHFLTSLSVWLSCSLTCFSSLHLSSKLFSVLSSLFFRSSYANFCSTRFVFLYLMDSSFSLTASCSNLFTSASSWFFSLRQFCSFSRIPLISSTVFDNSFFSFTSFPSFTSSSRTFFKDISV